MAPKVLGLKGLIGFRRLLRFLGLSASRVSGLAVDLKALNPQQEPKVSVSELPG